MLSKFTFSIFLLTLFSSVATANIFAFEEKPPIAIIGAFNEELKLLENQMADKRGSTIMGMSFISGNIYGQDVVLCSSGAGKVNASVAITLLIEHFKPSHVIFTGIAGALNDSLKQGDIIIAHKVAHHDFGFVLEDTFQHHPTRNPLNREENPFYFPADSILLNLAVQASRNLGLDPIKDYVPKIKVGTVLTGDVFVSSNEKREYLHTTFKADAVEMEGAAIAQVCWQFEVPCIIIRSISDLAGNEALPEIEAFYKTAAKNSASLILKMLEICE